MHALLVEEVQSNGETIRSRLDLTHWAVVAVARRTQLNHEVDDDATLSGADAGAGEAPRATE